jgi:hypothetical protein
MTQHEDEKFKDVYEHLHAALNDVPEVPVKDRIGGGGGNKWPRVGTTIGSAAGPGGFYVTSTKLKKGDPEYAKVVIADSVFMLVGIIGFSLILYALITMS